MDVLQNPLFVINVSTGLIFIITTFITNKYPPKGINPVYGYRSKRSMKSIDHWNFAQSYSTKLLHKIGIVMVLLGLLGYYISFSILVSTLLSLAIMTILVIYLYVKTENAIREKFGD